MSMDAQHALDMGAKYPYDAEDVPTPPVDWAHAAARGVLADLCDRRGINWEFESVDTEVRIDIVEALSAIIRLAGEVSDKPLRDYFAAHALAGVNTATEQEAARRAYAVADAMLAERAK